MVSTLFKCEYEKVFIVSTVLYAEVLIFKRKTNGRFYSQPIFGLRYTIPDLEGKMWAFTFYAPGFKKGILVVFIKYVVQVQ